jgi:hypothetical protein
MTRGSFLPRATHASCSGRAQRQTAPAECDEIVALSSPQDAYSADFAAQTTPEINAAVDARYGVNTYASNFIKKSCTPMALRGPGRGGCACATRMPRLCQCVSVRWARY